MSVVIKNKLGQQLPVPVADDKGRPRTVTLPKYGQSEPMPASNVTKHTKKLEAQGYIRIREVKES